MDDYLFMRVVYDKATDSFSSSGTLNERGQREVLETFLRMEFGRGVDHTPRADLPRYTIQLVWHPEDDRVAVESDTGNDALRDGILLEYLRRLDG